MSTRIEITLEDSVVDELKQLINHHELHGAPNRQTSVESLLSYVASAVADGSRRPGSWERGCVEAMGLVPDFD